ncbi:MAG: DnaJ domain-containing protein [Bdellovibrio bacteriovorus]
MARLLILAGVILGVLWFLHWFRRTPPAQVARTLPRVGLWALIGVLVLAAATGRLNPIFAAIGALIPVVIRLVQVAQLLPALQRVLRSLGLGGSGLLGGSGPAGGSPGAGPGASGAQASEIRTRFLVMRLDHGSGVMDGEVLEGPFAGRRLSDLELDALLRMLELYRDQDGQSAAVLEAYLDRERGPEWRDQDGAGSTNQPSAASGPMSDSEAWAILGLEPGADAAAIRAAHRRLMQKLHPDRGGSDYLAAKINEAKRVLLKERS